MRNLERYLAAFAVFILLVIIGLMFIMHVRMMLQVEYIYDFLQSVTFSSGGSGARYTTEL